MTDVFCTYFDSNYLQRGLALWSSLRQHHPDSVLWILCLDQRSLDVMSRLSSPSLATVSLGELERFDPELAGVKPGRSRIEYYFTATPAFIRYVLQIAKCSAVTYLDADLFFFSSPRPIFDEIGADSIAIVEHRFPPALADRKRYGRFNVGWVTIRADECGLECLGWWRDRCIEWCYDRVESDRFADQKYLDRWPELFASTHVIQHKGANLAPWNIAGSTLTIEDSRVVVEGDQLIFFHFHGLQRVNPLVIDPNLAVYGGVVTGLLTRRVYGPYVAACEGAITGLKEDQFRVAERTTAQADGGVRSHAVERPDFRHLISEVLHRRLMLMPVRPVRRALRKKMALAR